MKNEAEIIWWKTVKQDVETTPRRFTEAGARVVPGELDDADIFKRGSSAHGNYNSSPAPQADGFTLPCHLRIRERSFG